jgi:hypothetical protein
MSAEPQLTGLAKTFNSVTFTGRANVAKATYASRTAGWREASLTCLIAGILMIVVAVKAKGYISAK